WPEMMAACRHALRPIGDADGASHHGAPLARVGDASCAMMRIGFDFIELEHRLDAGFDVTKDLRPLVPRLLPQLRLHPRSRRRSPLARIEPRALELGKADGADERGPELWFK